MNSHWAQYAADLPKLQGLLRAFYEAGEEIPSLVSALDVTGEGVLAEMRDDFSGQDLMQLVGVLGAAIPTLRTITVVVADRGEGWCTLVVVMVDVATGGVAGYVDFREANQWVSMGQEDAARIAADLAAIIGMGMAIPQVAPPPQAPLKVWIDSVIRAGLAVDVVEVSNDAVSDS